MSYERGLSRKNFSLVRRDAIFIAARSVVD
jgi:hypothetical protein